MKSVLLSPSSVNPKTHICKMEDKESCYFPSCRKDANCDCEMCLASINATLDLVPISAQKSTLTKLSASKPVLETTPVSIDRTLLSTHDSTTRPSPSAPALGGVAKSGNQIKFAAKKRNSRFRGMFWKWVLFLGMVFAFEFGFSSLISRVLSPALSGEIMENVVEDFSSVEGFTERLNLVQKGLQGILGDGVSSCNLGNSTWTIDRDGLIMHSYCVMYQSAAEEVIVRGWPLQTTGLLTAGLSPRLFSVLSGRLTEWPEGNMAHTVRSENSTWILRKWGASVVKFDANTWIIEYRINMFLEDPNILSAVVKFLNYRITRFLMRMMNLLWLLPDSSNYAAYNAEKGSSLPT